MFTHKQLKLIRAALEYFDEEICPHGGEAIAGYVSGEEVGPNEVTELEEMFEGCDLRCLICTPALIDLLNSQPLNMPSDATENLATVLLFPVQG